MIASILNLAGPDILIILALPLLLLLTIGPWIWAIVHCAKNPALSDNQRIVWILIVIFLQILGAILYFLAAPKRPSPIQRPARHSHERSL